MLSARDNTLTVDEFSNGSLFADEFFVSLSERVSDEGDKDNDGEVDPEDSEWPFVVTS